MLIIWEGKMPKEFVRVVSPMEETILVEFQSPMRIWLTRIADGESDSIFFDPDTWPDLKEKIDKVLEPYFKLEEKQNA